MVAAAGLAMGAGHLTDDGLLPSGSKITEQYGRREQGGLVKRSGAAGESAIRQRTREPGLRLVKRRLPSAMSERQ